MVWGFEPLSSPEANGKPSLNHQTTNQREDEIGDIQFQLEPFTCEFPSLFSQVDYAGVNITMRGIDPNKTSFAKRKPAQKPLKKQNPHKNL